VKTNTPAPKPYTYLPHAPISLRTAVWAVLTGVALAMPVSAFVMLLPLPGPDADMVRVSATRLAPLYVKPWWIALHALVIAPLWEEFVYRGLMLQMLRRYLPTWLAVAIPTLIFAGTHFAFSYHNAVLAAIVGLCFSGLALRSGSLYPAILCHAGVNLAAVFILRPIFDAAALNHAGAWREPLPLLLLASSLALLVAGLRALSEETARCETDIIVTPTIPLPSA
jgi:membrane protease YdiL (CAAX protease family)